MLFNERNTRYSPSPPDISDPEFSEKLFVFFLPKMLANPGKKEVEIRAVVVTVFKKFRREFPW
jgi:hypothetical protein